MNYQATVLQNCLSQSETDTENIAEQFARTLPSHAFIALRGDLGAGKTAFVRGLARVVSPTSFVCSPTYALVNEYHSESGRLIHFDMYRIHDEESLYMTGFYDYFDDNSEKKCIYAVEWSENIEFALPKEYYEVEIQILPENRRRITIQDIKRLSE